MSNDQLSLNKWSTLLEPTPSQLRQKASPPPVEEPPVAEPPQDVAPEVLTVSHLNQLIKGQIEEEFKSVWVQGEISNFKAHTSGHYYFSLKDNKSQISAVMFKGFNNKLKFQPENGMEVMVRGRVTVYEPRGNYQIFCESMEPLGAGALQRAYEQLKNKLQSEGLFSLEHKKRLPLLPKSIGVVTSPTGAAIQDILHVLGRRYRSGQITVIPARVQGEGAADEIVRGIELANRVASFDVLIVGRGGGSIEDMWCFNEEKVARAIFASQIPIISAVGHEIDFTIADFVADVRAPTPSAAAEMVVKSATELAEKISYLQTRLSQKWQYHMSQWSGRVQVLQSRLVDPQRHLQDLALRCDELQQRLQLSWQRLVRDWQMQIRLAREQLKNPRVVLDKEKQRLFNASQRLRREIKQLITSQSQTLIQRMGLLDSLSPLRVVQRGYSLVFSGEEIVKSAAKVSTGEELHLEVSDGALRVKVLGTTDSKIKISEEKKWTSKKN